MEDTWDITWSLSHNWFHHYGHSVSIYPCENIYSSELLLDDNFILVVIDFVSPGDKIFSSMLLLTLKFNSIWLIRRQLFNLKFINSCFFYNKISLIYKKLGLI